MSRERLPVIGGDDSSTESPDSSDSRPQNSLNQDNFSGNVLLVTLGCAKNLVDSEVMLGALESRGFRPVVEPEQADLIVVNTCAFLQSAVDESVDRILELIPYKQEGRCKRIVVAGCMVERYRDALRAELPEVDQFLSTDELLKAGDDSETSSECLDSARRPYFLYDESMPRLLSAGEVSTFVKIAEGCSKPCSFCIIPKLRGDFRSRTISSVAAEVQALRAKNVKEFNLVAQDTTSFGVDRSSASRRFSELETLLKELAALDGEFGAYWLRLLYAYPSGVTESLLDLISDSSSICNYLDLPLQHISHPVLKRMHRPLGGKKTRELIEGVRNKHPHLALRTTFLVGFPGETEEDIHVLEEFVKEGHFVHVGVFTYSQEEGSDSFMLPNQVEQELKEERRARIMTAQREVVARRMKGLLGTRERVLIEGAHRESDLLLVARAQWQAPETDGEIIINEVDESLLDKDGEASLDHVCGKFGEVEVNETAEYDLIGKLISIE